MAGRGGYVGGCFDHHARDVVVAEFCGRTILLSVSVERHRCLYIITLTNAKKHGTEGTSQSYGCKTFEYVSNTLTYPLKNQDQ